MQVIVTAVNGNVKPLSLEVLGFKVEVSDFSENSKLVISENAGIISVAVEKLSSLNAEPQASAVKEETPLPKQEPEGDVEATEKASPPEALEGEKPCSDELFRKLTDLRKRIANENGCPAYTVFQDKSLHAMCEALPQDSEAMKSIHGVGAARLEKYGSMFIEVIRQHLEVA